MQYNVKRNFTTSAPPPKKCLSTHLTYIGVHKNFHHTKFLSIPN